MGKEFFLTEDIGLIQVQLEEGTLSPDQTVLLAPGVSTDTIFPTKGATAALSELGRYALSGHHAISEGALQKLRPSVLFVGDGFGAGSAREHAPAALKQCGVEAIVCLGTPNKTFAETCYLLGIAVYLCREAETVARIADVYHTGQLEAVYQDQLRPDIAHAGGLTAYSLLRLEGKVEPIAICHQEVRAGHPMTATEKILASKMVNVRSNQHGEKVVLPGDTGFVSVDLRTSYSFHTPLMQPILGEFTQRHPLRDPGSIHLFQDHAAQIVTMTPDLKFAQLIRSQEVMAHAYGITLQAPSKDAPYLTEGIAHTLCVEQALVGPGNVAVGTDSHTGTLGVLNTIAWGIGATHMANAMATGEALIEVPPTIKINFDGFLSPNTAPKDVILYLLSQEFVTNGLATGSVLEFDGRALDQWSLDMQLVLTNMAIESGAMTGLITRLTPALIHHLQAAGNMTSQEIETNFVTSDPQASFLYQIETDLDDIEPMVALPGSPRNAIPISQLEPIPITQAYIGSCTGGNLDDLRRAALVLQDQRIHPQVRLLIQPASVTILEQARKEGWLRIFENAGAQIVGFGCGACIGLGPGRTGNEGVTVSATNRNFPRRMGGESPVYLASPATAALAAVRGFLGKS